jgi:hypothetical protein
MCADAHGSVLLGPLEKRHVASFKPCSVLLCLLFVGIFSSVTLLLGFVASSTLPQGDQTLKKFTKSTAF